MSICRTYPPIKTIMTGLGSYFGEGLGTIF